MKRKDRILSNPTSKLSHRLISTYNNQRGRFYSEICQPSNPTKPFEYIDGDKVWIIHETILKKWMLRFLVYHLNTNSWALVWHINLREILRTAVDNIYKLIRFVIVFISLVIRNLSKGRHRLLKSSFLKYLDFSNPKLMHNSPYWIYSRWNNCQAF